VNKLFQNVSNRIETRMISSDSLHGDHFIKTLFCFLKFISLHNSSCVVYTENCQHYDAPPGELYCCVTEIVSPPIQWLLDE